MIPLEPHPDGVILSVRAQAGARKNAITGVHNGMLKVSVTQAPEKGKANQAIIDLLRRSLSLKKSQLTLLSGETSPQKRLLIRDASMAELAASLAALLKCDA